MTQAAQKILNAFDQDNLPFWAVYDHQKVLFKCNQEDEDICASSEKLKSVLEFLEDGTKSYTVYIFYQVPDGGFKKYQTVNFKKLEPDGYYTYNPYKSAELVTDRRVYTSDRESRMFEAIEKLAAEVTALKAAHLEDDEEPEIEQQAESNILGAIFNNDQMKAVLAGLVANMAGKFISGGSAPIALAGTDVTEDDRISTAIDVLKKHDTNLADHLEKLAIMSENETNKFKMLISML